MKRRARVLGLVLGFGVALVGCDDDGDDDASDASTQLDSGADVVVRLDARPDSNGGMDAGPDATFDAPVRMDAPFVPDGAAPDGPSVDGAAPDGGIDAGMMTSAECADYCSAVTTNCTGGNAQYENQGACVSTCQAKLAWPAGSGTASANTVACRTYHAGLASTDPATHCPHAGVTGGAVCGSLCENYCYIMDNYCPNAYTSLSQCAEACSGFSTAGPTDAQTGNTLYCRLNQAVAAGAAPGTHCPNAAQASPVCAE